MTTAISAVLLSVSACSTYHSPPLEEFAFSQAQMGLEFRITLFGPDEATARDSAAAAFARVAELNSILSDYDSDSELSRLSQSAGSGEWKPVSDDLWRVLEAGQKLARQTDGAFDLTVGPSVNLWRRARRQEELPGADLLERMRERVGFRFLQLDPLRQSARLTRPDMRLDAGGIAKGYALDEALNVLHRHGIRRVMIHAGGDMVLGDPPPDREGWKIELPNMAAAASPRVVELGNCALATSGDLFQFVEIEGTRYSHIVDPRTGIGLTNRSLVHVIAPRGITADSLATAISVLGHKAGMKLLSHYPGTSCQVAEGVGADATVSRSKEFNHHLATP